MLPTYPWFFFLPPTVPLCFFYSIILSSFIIIPHTLDYVLDHDQFTPLHLIDGMIIGISLFSQLDRLIRTVSQVQI
jgi:hypothetical protein